MSQDGADLPGGAADREAAVTASRSGEVAPPGKPANVVIVEVSGHPLEDVPEAVWCPRCLFSTAERRHFYVCFDGKPQNVLTVTECRVCGWPEEAS